MGKRPAARQGSPLWVTTADLPTNAGHPFFERLNRVLEDAGFDAFAESLCAVFYAARMGRPSLRPGRYLRMLLIGYFEGLSSERGIAWRVADSLSLRSFLDLDVTETSADHSTLSRTRRLVDVETHEAVFTWVLERLAEAGLVAGKTVGIDTYGEGEGGAWAAPGDRQDPSARGNEACHAESSLSPPSRSCYLWLRAPRSRSRSTVGRYRPRSRSGRCRSQRHQHRTNRNPHGREAGLYSLARSRGHSPVA